MGTQNEAQWVTGRLLQGLTASRLGPQGSPLEGSAAPVRPVSFLLDTNVVSEWTRLRPNPGVVEWLAQVEEDEVFLGVATIAELRRGMERLPAGERRRRLDEWLRNDLALRFEGRIIGVDGAIADEWGRMIARRETRGRPMGAMDALVAATARVHDLTVVTRNATDFQGSVKTVLNPWA